MKNRRDSPDKATIPAGKSLEGNYSSNSIKTITQEA